MQDDINNQATEEKFDTDSEKNSTTSPTDIIKTARENILSSKMLQVFPDWFSKLFAAYSTVISIAAFVYCWIFANFTSALIATICLAGTNAAILFGLIKLSKEKFSNSKTGEESISLEEHLLSQQELISNEINPKLSNIEAEIENLKSEIDQLKNSINKNKSSFPENEEQWFDKPFPNPDEVLFPAEEDVENEDANIEATSNDKTAEDISTETKSEN